MKKFWTLLLALTLSVNMLAACGDSVTGESNASSAETSTSEEHVHSFSTDWKRSTSSHWRVCACGEKTDLAQHEGTAPSCTEKPVCDTCGKIYGEVAGHDYSNKTKKEEEWVYSCTVCEDEVALSGLVDFTVEVETGRDPVVLQLSDTQLMNVSQSGNENTCYKYVRETVAATNPDLIILTGDLVYGRFDNKQGTMFTQFVAFMDSLNVPWAPVFGNHDNECWLGVDWQCEQLENAKNCLFKQGDLTGNGNYTVGVMQGEELLRVFFMMDSNGCGQPMVNGATGDDSALEHNTSPVGKNQVKTGAGFANDQTAWLKNTATALKSMEPNVKLSVAYHIQQAAFKYAFEKYGYKAINAANGDLRDPIDVDVVEGKEEGDFGYVGRALKGPWDTENLVYNMMKLVGVDSIFVGHEHCNSASIVYEGIRFQFGQKSSICDRYNVLTSTGAIVGGYNGSGTPLIGGTAFSLSQEDGSIINPYIYLCGDVLGRNPKAA